MILKNGILNYENIKKIVNLNEEDFFADPEIKNILKEAVFIGE